MTRRSLGIAFALLVIPIAARSDEPPASDHNARVAAFARSKLGEKVGNGVCSTFIQEALRDAGAKVLLEPEADGEYLWGERVKSARDAKPGDIIQFEKATFKGRRRIVDEYGRPSLLLTKQMFPHHSAIIVAVGPKGKTLTLRHQNAAGPDGNPVMHVTEATIVMSELQKGGSVKIYRPVAP